MGCNHRLGLIGSSSDNNVDGGSSNDVVVEQQAPVGTARCKNAVKRRLTPAEKQRLWFQNRGTHMMLETEKPRAKRRAFARRPRCPNCDDCGDDMPAVVAPSWDPMSEEQRLRLDYARIRRELQLFAGQS